MGINWNARQDGTNRPRRLRGNSSARLVSSARRLHGTAWNLYLLGMALQRNMCSITQLGKTRPLASITRAQETVQTRATQHALYRFVAGSQSRVYERRLAAEILLNVNTVATASTSTTTSGTSTESSQASPTSYSGSEESDQIYSTQSSNTGQSSSQMRNDNQMNLPDCSVTAPEEVASTASPVRPKRKLFREMESQVTLKKPKGMRNMALQKTPPTSGQTQMTPKGRRTTFSNTDLTLSKYVQTPIPSQNFVVKKSTFTQTVIETEDKSVQACLEKIELLESSDKELKKITGIENYKLFEILHKYIISKNVQTAYALFKLIVIILQNCFLIYLLKISYCLFCTN
ncbi:uncharacterized protein LOC127856562 [Dreissena polymorpha]|uniref:uncharacterized protein LOC127856562 n=1 Tax=Dreissena polymorpha TaxID=45954 RepID=UPI002264F3B2|nr:uncharacterized protein LOC127856562 [Dreissena polymorpha]